MSAPRRACALLSRLPEGDVIGAEVGVYDGRMSQILLGRKDLSLVMVDAWLPDARYRASGDPRSTANMKAAREQAMKATKFAGQRRVIAHGTSLEAAHAIADHSLDFVFLDADHSEESVREDIHAWTPKLKERGLLGGHDYAHPDYPGVERAVTALLGPVEHGDDRTWFWSP